MKVSWALIQISHLSMTGDLTKKDGERVWLNSIRNAFTVIASIAIHVTAMFMLDVTAEDEKENQTNIDVRSSGPEQTAGHLGSWILTILRQTWRSYWHLITLVSV